MILTIEKNSMGYSVIDDEGNYVHDKNNNNTFDTWDEAEDVRLIELMAIGTDADNGMED
jgi:hypothetical protein